MNKLLQIIVSTRTMAVLLFLYAFAMGYATFLENDYGTVTAKALIYEAKWFEVLMLLIIINFIGNISRYRLWRREKWSVLAFHLSFILIFIGGAITRYISFEGTMRIPEKKESSEIVTEKNYFKIQIEKGGDIFRYQEIPYLMSPLHKDFQAKYDFNGQKVSVKAVDYIFRKKDSLYASAHPKEYFHFVVAGNQGRENHYLASGETTSLDGMLVSYNRHIDGAINFSKQNGNLQVNMPAPASFMVMATQEQGKVVENVYEPLKLRSLYTMGELRIVVPEGIRKGELKAIEGDKVKDKDVPDMLTVEVEGPKTKQLVNLTVERGNANLYKQISLDGLNIILGFGPKIIKMPFSIRLNDFVMENYPGSNSPSAYESHVSVIDEGKATPHKIFMNNVLNYKGYRFYQASFFPDQSGTVLSVNHDFWGTLITYIGYTVLFFSMFISLFWKGTHFHKLNTTLKNLSKKKAVGMLAVLLSISSLSAQKIETHGVDDGSASHQHSSGEMNAAPEKVTAPPRTGIVISAEKIIAENKISKEHAEKFGSLLVQNIEGRIVPANTQALDILRKLYKHDKFSDKEGNSLDANQWFLSMNIDTPSWTMVPLIKIGSKGGDELLKKTKADEDGYTSLMNLFPVGKDGTISFVLEKDFQKAFKTKPSEQSSYDKEVISINEKVQIFNQFFTGQFLRSVPVQNDPNHRWNSWLDAEMKDDVKAQALLGPYLASVMQATRDGNWAKANAELEKVKAYQQKWGKDVIPDANKVKLEILMNKLNVNFWLMIFYSVIGGLLLFTGFIELFTPKKWMKTAIKSLLIIGVVGYVIQFLGLAARWYISGNAPWSNGYEAIIFISWIGISAGLALYKNSNALVPAAGFMVAVIMMGFAHGGSALDPQITPLVPVLKSYWLIVHVAIITSSYGFFGLSMVIAFIVLMFYVLANRKQYELHREKSIRELTIVSEMSLTIGLFLLTIGTFMGGIWANESWGRYWSWDPKETWAFVSVMVYAFVLHMRLVPGLRGRWAFHTAAMFAVCSVVMTYFGVNYYLSGLHSYAKGDPIPVPLWVYVSLSVMFLLAVISYFKFKKLQNHSPKQELSSDPAK